MQSSTNVQARENELATLKAEHSKKNDQLVLELERMKKQLSNELAEANVEITQRGQLLERKERMLWSCVGSPTHYKVRWKMLPC